MSRTIKVRTISTISAAAGLALAVALMLGAAAARPGAADVGAEAGADAAGGLEQDLAMLQGKWEREPAEYDEPPRPSDAERSVKEIKGNRETITYYGADGKVIRATAADFRLEESGRVKLYTYSNWRVTAGEGKGKTVAGPKSYIYRLKEDRVYEGHDLLTDADPETRPKVQVWKRVGE